MDLVSGQEMPLLSCIPIMLDAISAGTGWHSAEGSPNTWWSHKTAGRTIMTCHFLFADKVRRKLSKAGK